MKSLDVFTRLYKIMPDQEKLEHFSLPLGAHPIQVGHTKILDISWQLGDRGDGVPFQMHAKKVKAKK